MRTTRSLAKYELCNLQDAVTLLLKKESKETLRSCLRRNEALIQGEIPSLPRPLIVHSDDQRDHFPSLNNQCVYIHFPWPTVHVNNCKAVVKQSNHRESDSIYLPYSINIGLKISIESKHVLCTEETSQTENKFKVANCGVENLEHQSWQLNCPKVSLK